MSEALAESLSLLARALIMFALVWLVLKLADPNRFLGNSGSAVIGRIMALLIAAIAVQYILDGVTHYLTAA